MADYAQKADRIMRAAQQGTLVLDNCENMTLAKARQQSGRLTSEEMILIEELLEKLEEQDT